MKASFPISAGWLRNTTTTTTLLLHGHLLIIFFLNVSEVPVFCLFFCVVCWCIDDHKMHSLSLISLCLSPWNGKYLFLLVLDLPVVRESRNVKYLRVKLGQKESPTVSSLIERTFQFLHKLLHELNLFQILFLKFQLKCFSEYNVNWDFTRDKSQHLLFIYLIND